MQWIDLILIFHQKKYTFKAISPMDQRCGARLEVGHCRLVQPKYLFDKERNRCVEKSLGDCSGDEDKFDTMQECTSACVRYFL